MWYTKNLKPVWKYKAIFHLFGAVLTDNGWYDPDTLKKISNFALKKWNLELIKKESLKGITDFEENFIAILK